MHFGVPARIVEVISASARMSVRFSYSGGDFVRQTDLAGADVSFLSEIDSKNVKGEMRQ